MHLTPVARGFVGEYPHTLQEFEERFQTVAVCRDYLLQQRWPGGPSFHLRGGVPNEKTRAD